MTAEEIEELTDFWATLISALDYHDGKWYLCEEGTGDWELLSFQNLHDELYDLGVGDKIRFEPIYQDGMIISSRLIPDPDRAKVIQQFRYRDEETHPRARLPIFGALSYASDSDSEVALRVGFPLPIAPTLVAQRPRPIVFTITDAR